MGHIIKDEAHYKQFMQEKRIELQKKLQSEWGKGIVSAVTNMPNNRGGFMKVVDRWGPTARLLLIDNLQGLREHYLVWQTPVGAAMVVNWAFVA